MDMGIENCVTIFTDLPTVSDFPDNLSVGKTYEVGINGVGYMLFDNFPDGIEENKWSRFTRPLEAQRLATGETPFSQAIENYSFAAWSSLRGGAGVRYRRSDGPDHSFWDSGNVDPFTDPFHVSLLKKTRLSLATPVSGKAAALGTGIYLTTDADEVTHLDTHGGTETAFTIAAATTLTDMCADGEYWYACDGASIFRNNTAADPGAAWATDNAQVIDFAGQRICAGVATGSLPNRFTTLNSAGAEEVAGGRITLSATWSITNFSDGNGYVYFGARDNTNRGYVYKWQIGSADVPTIAAELPLGVQTTRVLAYQGQVIVMATSNNKGLVYRCPIDSSGNITPFLVAEIGEAGTATDYGRGALGANDRFVFFGWVKMDGTNTGVGCLDLSTDGYSKYWISNDTGDVTDVVLWDDPQGTAFVVDSSGLYSVNPEEYWATGWVKTEFIDAESGIGKIFDSVSIRTRPLNASQTITVSTSLNDNDASYNIITPSFTGAGSIGGELTINKLTKILGLKIELAGPGTSTPLLSLVQLRFHPVGLADEILVLPINCGDTVEDLNGKPVPDSGKGLGAVRARTLKNLVQTRVRVQDVDWPWIGVADIYEVLQVQTSKVSVKDRHSGKIGLHMVCIMTLRRLLK